jgi:hypothetical protein
MLGFTLIGNRREQWGPWTSVTRGII